MEQIPGNLKFRILQYRQLVFPEDPDLLTYHNSRLLKLAINDNRKGWLVSTLKYSRLQLSFPIISAAETGNVEFLLLLCDAGFKISKHAACYAVINGHSECLRIIIELGGKIHQDTMFWAVKQGHIACVKMLIELKDSITRNRPAYIAAENGRLEFLQLFHQNGYIIDADCVHIAAKNGHLECSRYPASGIPRITHLWCVIYNGC